jgi:hypothetical protein
VSAALGGTAEPVEQRRWSAGTAALLFTAATVTFTSAFAAFLRMQGSSDLTVHIAYAKDLHSLADLKSPHFLFQLLLNAVHAFGVTHETVAVWLLGGCYGAMAVLIAVEIRQRGVDLSAFRMVLVVMALLLASHIFLASVRASHIYSGYFVPTAYHNPTQQLNKLFALSIWFIYARQFLRAPSPDWWAVPLLAVLCVGSAIAKPSFLIAFLPIAALYAARDLVLRQWRRALTCLAGIGIPSALILLWQTTVSASAGEPVRIAFVPFALFPANETLYKLPASLAFPLIVAAGALWTRTSDARLRFIWAMTALALFVTICIVEAGERMNHGNFAWTGQTGVFLAYVESTLFLLAQRTRAWTITAWTVFAVHVACGLMWYGIVFGDNWGNWL